MCGSLRLQFSSGRMFLRCCLLLRRHLYFRVYTRRQQRVCVVGECLIEQVFVILLLFAPPENEQDNIARASSRAQDKATGAELAGQRRQNRYRC